MTVTKLLTLPPDYEISVPTPASSNLCIDVNRNIVQPEIDGGVELQDLRPSTWRGSILKTHFIDHGMRLEFRHPKYRTPIGTSPIHEIRRFPQWPTSQMRALDGAVGSAQTV